MIWTIIGLIVCIVEIVKVCCDEYFDWSDKLGTSFLIMLASILGIVLVTLSASLITTSCVDADYNMVSDTQIVALKDNQNTNGNFYIMGGYVNEDLYYYYATETEFGYKTEKIKANHAYVKYTDGETHIEEYKGDFKNDIAYLFGYPVYDRRYIIYCPDDTVTNEFKIDLE